MKTREWMGQYRELKRECAYIEACIAEKEKAVRLCDAEFQKQIQATRELLQRRKEELLTVEAEILECIGLVEESRLRLLLSLRYIEGLHWEEIANRISYDYFYTVKKLHPAALREVETIKKQKEI